jgi:hypothetical protein
LLLSFNDLSYDRIFPHLKDGWALAPLSAKDQHEFEGADGKGLEGTFVIDENLCYNGSASVLLNFLTAGI